MSSGKFKERDIQYRMVLRKIIDGLGKGDVTGGAVQHGRGKSVLWVLFQHAYIKHGHAKALCTGAAIHSSGKADSGGQK